ncbi:MAG: hypothetical protein K9N06_05425 [Candidatus Cloacimonetes bacterium]|nr:hypothetical protein [Candidatus Cloacimonadota bacterium]
MKLHGNKTDISFMKYIALVGQLGLVMVVNIILWFALIRWLISLAGFSLNLQFIGIIIGIAAGGFSSYKLMEKQLRIDKKDE